MTFSILVSVFFLFLYSTYRSPVIHAVKHLKAREDAPCIRITEYVTNIP